MGERLSGGSHINIMSLVCVRLITEFPSVAESSSFPRLDSSIGAGFSVWQGVSKVPVELRV